MKMKRSFEEIWDGIQDLYFCMNCFAPRKFNVKGCCGEDDYIPLKNFDYEFQFEIAKDMYDAQ